MEQIKAFLLRCVSVSFKVMFLVFHVLYHPLLASMRAVEHCGIQLMVLYTFFHHGVWFHVLCAGSLEHIHNHTFYESE